MKISRINLGLAFLSFLTLTSCEMPPNYIWHCQVTSWDTNMTFEIIAHNNALAVARTESVIDKLVSVKVLTRPLDVFCKTSYIISPETE